jgi:uncharacterized repeat protein (TIGR03803 family)
MGKMGGGKKRIAIGYAAFLLAALCALPESARAVSEEVLYSFTGGADGGEPDAGLIVVGGKIYGTTLSGGAFGQGTVFAMTPPLSPTDVWTEKAIYSFKGASDGSGPFATLISDKSGALYGTTQTGGANSLGTVFKLTPPTAPGGPWTESILYAFRGGSDGGYPRAGLTSNKSGTLFGTTAGSGGDTIGATVFVFLPPTSPESSWREAALTDLGSGSTARLLIGKAGALFGTTVGTGGAGGPILCGSIFELSPPSSPSSAWTLNILVALPYNLMGNCYEGNDLDDSLVPDGRGNLYTTAFMGGPFGSRTGGSTFGTVLQISPMTGLHPIYAFTGGSDGANPAGSLVSLNSGSLVGTTEGGGTGFGTVFTLTPNPTTGKWIETVLHSFSGGADGRDPESGVLLLNGLFVGTTRLGGTSDAGTVYVVKP